MSKIKKRNELIKICNELRKSNKKIGFTSGAFDIIHAGHVDYLKRAKKECDILIVGLNTDNSIKKYKSKNRPINSEKDRLKVISSLLFIDYVFLFDELNNNVNIELLKPHFYIKAGDYNENELTSKPIVEKFGGRVILIPLKHNISTTKIIEKINSLDLYQSIKLKKEKVKIAFIDRDGTINKNKHFIHKIDDFELEKNALEGLTKIQNKGYKIIIVTNQQGIGLGYYNEEDFYKFNTEIFKAVSKNNIKIDKIFYCPHSLANNCNCMKPKIGLFEKAKKFYDIDMNNSVMIGDLTSDIEFGKNAKLKTILLKTGHNGSDKKYDVKPDFIANDLLDASKYLE
jgi:rfaE bifunctional protein nucleotidyltransferase chain/domain